MRKFFHTINKVMVFLASFLFTVYMAGMIINIAMKMGWDDNDLMLNAAYFGTLWMVFEHWCREGREKELSDEIESANRKAERASDQNLRFG